MPHEHEKPGLLAEGAQPEALSNEVLKLKIDDLFQEMESLKRRVARLEGNRESHEQGKSSGATATTGVVSDPDRPRSSGI